MTHELICPLCGEENLEVVSYSDSFQVPGGKIDVDGLLHGKCNACGAEPLTPEHIKHNHALVAEAKRNAADKKRHTEGLLPSYAIRLIRDYFGISQQQASTLFGGGANAFSKYERGEVIQSVAMDRLLKLAIANPHLIEQIEILAEFESHADHTGVTHDFSAAFSTSYETLQLLSGESLVAPKQPLHRDHCKVKIKKPILKRETLHCNGEWEFAA